MDRVLGIILARKGSKSVPGKNMAMFGSVPLITRTIRSAKECRLFDDIVVSTDWPEIFSIANAEGVSFIKRPDELSGDDVTSESCIANVLETFVGYDIVVLVQNTTPFHNPEDMAKIIDLVSNGYASAIAVCETHKYRWTSNGESIQPECHDRKRRQDRRPYLEEAGGLYGFRSKDFLEHGTMFCEPVGAVTVSWLSGIDINTHGDMALARMLSG